MVSSRTSPCSGLVASPPELCRPLEALARQARPGVEDSSGPTNPQGLELLWQTSLQPLERLQGALEPPPASRAQGCLAPRHQLLAPPRGGLVQQQVSLEDCSAPLVNPPPSGRPTPLQGSGDLEHRQTSNLTRTSDSSELLTTKTSQPLASEDSGSQLQVLRQHSDQQGALEQPQVR